MQCPSHFRRASLLFPVCLLTMQTALTAAPRFEFIFDKAPFPSCHASTVVELQNGDLLAAWFGGSAEGRPDVAIWGSRRTDGHWSQPMEMAREPDIATFNPVLFYAPDRRLWLYYKFGPHPSSWSGARRFSTDNGKTWSEVEHLPAGLYGPIRAKPLVFPDGLIVSGTSVESYQSWAAWIERSTDNGMTFTRIGPITAAGKGIIQPSVVALSDTHLRFYARSNEATKRICVADSYDRGLTWTQARPLDLPNPNSGIDAVALRDGRIVLVYNASETQRTPLNLAVSTDGEHFRMFSTLEDQPGQYAYPSMIQGKDGDLHITYTWKREKIRYVRIPLADVPK
jgi:predicted neuraminidase